MGQNPKAAWRRWQVAELAAMAGFGGKGRKKKVAVKLGKRVSRKVATNPMAELSDSDDGVADGDDMEEEFVGAPSTSNDIFPDVLGIFQRSCYLLGSRIPLRLGRGPCHRQASCLSLSPVTSSPAFSAVKRHHFHVCLVYYRGLRSILPVASSAAASLREACSCRCQPAAGLGDRGALQRRRRRRGAGGPPIRRIHRLPEP